MKAKNVRNATAAGATAGGAGTLFTTWAAMELSRRTSVPAELWAGMLAAPVAVATGVFARWAARLNPHE